VRCSSAFLWSSATDKKKKISRKINRKINENERNRKRRNEKKKKKRKRKIEEKGIAVALVLTKRYSYFSSSAFLVTRYS
jgi:hypothetical protein